MSFTPEPPKSGILKQNAPDSEIHGIPEELMPNRSPSKKVCGFTEKKDLLISSLANFVVANQSTHFTITFNSRQKM